MDPADWRYLAEGRLHVLIAYEVRTCTWLLPTPFSQTMHVRKSNQFKLHRDRPDRIPTNIHAGVAQGPRNGDSDGGEQGTETAHDDHRFRFRHHVLRLLKQRHPDADAAAASSPAALYDTVHDRAYLDRVAVPLLGTQYVDVGWTVPLTRDFLQGVVTR